MAAAYLVRPKGKGYAFRMTVPKALRGRFRSPDGKPLSWVVEGLGTDSRKEAQTKAAKRQAHWLAQFERAATGAPLTLGEIEDAAREVYTATLARMANEAAVNPDKDEILWLPADLAIREQALERDEPAPVVHEIEALQRRHGIELDPASPTYATLARALLRAQLAAIAGRMKALNGEASERPATFLGAEGIDQRTLKPITLHRPLARLKAEHGPWWLFEQWIAEAKPAGSTVNRWRAVFLDLQNRFGEKEIGEDDAREWARGLVGPDRSPDTVAAIWLSSARRIYKWAVEQKLAASNPFANVKITVPDKPVTREKAFMACTRFG